QQSDNVNNIATTSDGGETWQIQASGKNGGYKTCVKIRPKSKGKDIIAVGDQNIEFSSDYGKTWKTISQEKNLYVCEWIDENSLVFAGKNRILKAIFK
ncbi:MAG: glycosyl hydrolase, partial [Cloacibacterium normanense]|nr:glycosyl hydrolase [Cloacibacterium normanense]